MHQIHVGYQDGYQSWQSHNYLKNQIPGYYYYYYYYYDNRSSQFFERIKYPPKTCKAFVSSFTKLDERTDGSLNLNCFQIPRPNGSLILNYFFQTPKNGGSLIFWIFFKYLELMSIKQKNQNTWMPLPPPLHPLQITPTLILCLHLSIDGCQQTPTKLMKTWKMKLQSTINNKNENPKIWNPVHIKTQIPNL